MASIIANSQVATEGNDFSSSFQDGPDLETSGKSAAIRCLKEAIDCSCVPRKVLADECGWSEGQFSKVENGKQGDLLDLVYRLPPARASIRAEFFGRLNAREAVDPVAHAAEQAAIAAIRLIRAMHYGARMAKAELRNRDSETEVA